MEVWLEDIHMDSEDRVRVDYGDVKRLVVSLAKYGQLQDVLVRPFREDEHNPDSKKWVLTDGARRFLAVSLANKSGVGILGLDVGLIGAKTKEEATEKESLLWEFFANEDRKDFNWKERAGFVQRIHEMSMVNEDGWDAQHTSVLLDYSEQTIYKYLAFYEDFAAFNDPRVQEAATFNTAYKQLQIVREERRRKLIVALQAKMVEKKLEEGVDSGEEAGASDEVDQAPYVAPSEFAQHICQLGDCTTWFDSVPDNTFDWVHWDPPYGGEQSGGATERFEKIDDTWPYAKALLRDVLPQIHRTLRPGHWLVLWYHPTYYFDIVTMLRGHELDEETLRCQHCGRDWDVGHLQFPCSKDRPGFWVNPYPNTWYKVDRVTSGQEIRRFLVNAQEHFLFAGALKEGNNSPILPKTDRQNVFVHNMTPHSERRHSMHKPAGLLEKILDCVSYPGEFGCDPSFGSGSIIEAALSTHRKVVGVELERSFRTAAIAAVEELIKEKAIESYDIPSTKISHSAKTSG